MDDELTPAHDELLIAIYGPDGPRVFREQMELSKKENPEFWGLDTDDNTE